MGIRTIPCIFGEEGRIKRLECVFCVFLCVKMCLGERKKCAKNVQAKSKTQKSPYSFGLEVHGAFYKPFALYEAKGRLLDWVYLDTPRKILTPYF